MRKALNEPFRTFFGTLANQYRLDIIETLRKKPLTAAQICDATKFKQPTVSINLKRLEHCGFVFLTKNGKKSIYRLNETTIIPMLKAMHTHTSQYCKKICRGER